eukprot:COSAG01_NODE_6204_length_3796_cov_10.893968_3_plen_90_part_00
MHRQWAPARLRPVLARGAADATPRTPVRLEHQTPGDGGHEPRDLPRGKRGSLGAPVDNAPALILPTQERITFSIHLTTAESGCISSATK